MSTAEELRMRIFQAAADEFREKGFNNASMRSVAARAGIAVGTIYNYVDTKYSLYQRIVELSWQKLQQQVEKLTTASLPLRAKLYTTGLYQLEFIQTHKNVWHDITEQAAEHPADAATYGMHKQTYSEYVGLISQMFTHAREQGKIKADFKALSDRSLAGIAVSLINSLQQNVPEQDLAKALEETLSIFFDGIAER